MNNTVISKSFGVIFAKKGHNTRTMYEHQKSAMECMDMIDQNSSYSTLIVLPTGGGKTYTASSWLIKNAVDKRKKILWIAHRHMLLDQAAESFQNYAFSDIMPHVSSFKYRIVSGSPEHERAIDISPDDELLIAGKDSIGRNIRELDDWLKNENEIFFVIDEAHHSTAKTYRRIIEYVKSRVPFVKLIGLTATPVRTAENEQGLLSMIYSDGVKNGNVYKGDIGITYQISLKELINRRILSKPIFECYMTDESFGDTVGKDGLDSIMHMDVIPADIAERMACNAARNRLIVETYKKKADVYGQTILFAVNITQAIALNALFRKAGIRSDYVVSDIKDMTTGITVSREDNNKKINEYKNGKLQVLINVNILTEGVDLPQTKTVFLTRPTVSTILMTQMIGRALRGSKAGGTDDAYIVSFVDKWNEHIAWVNPDSIFIDSENEFLERDSKRARSELRLIAISKIEEFASILDDSVDTTKLEKVPFVQRIPIGMYSFRYLQEDGLDMFYQVMVYNSTQRAYEEFMYNLPDIFESFGADDEYLSEELLYEMEEQCRDTFFCGDMVPTYQKKDVINILKYYAQYSEAPKFYSFDDIDRGKLNLTDIAKYIRKADMRRTEEEEYINNLWDSNDYNILRLFFGKKLYFLKQLDIELMKLSNPSLYESENNVVYGEKAIEDLPLSSIGKYYPELERKLRDETFKRSLTKDGQYKCAICGMRSSSRVYFQVDHIIPLNKGGKSVQDNLQILCRRCNGIKGDS